MDTDTLLGKIRAHKDTQETLAAAIGLSRTRLSCKLHGRNGASFTQPEILAIKRRYQLSEKEIDEIFFS